MFKEAEKSGVHRAENVSSIFVSVLIAAIKTG